MTIDETTALVITDPELDFLSPDGVTWGMVGKNAEANNTVENLETLLKVARKQSMQVFISPRYNFPTDHGQLSFYCQHGMDDARLLLHNDARRIKWTKHTTH